MGALMINMDCNHPDIEEFIDVKTDLNKITHANISVNVTDEFMQAVKNDEMYTLSFTIEGKDETITKEVRAKELFRKLAKNNWNYAEPGILYKNRLDTHHIMSEDKSFELAGTNPCGEQPLPAYGSCNLASINLSEFVVNPFEDNAQFDTEKFIKAVHNGVIYLNEVLDDNLDFFPLEEQKQVAIDLRQIGLGIMGLADCFIKLGLNYGSGEARVFSHYIGKIMINEAMRQSALLAKEDGPFPRYKEEYVLASPFIKENINEDVLELIKKYGLRNSQLLTAAPTGSIATLIGASNGIEPLFQISYTRRSVSLHDQDTLYKVYTPLAKEYMEKFGLEKESDLPSFFVTSQNLNYIDRLKMQAVWQQYIDAAISSTVNVPNEFTIDEVEDLYFKAWELGLKGVTIYRDGCAREGILTTETTKKKEELKEMKEDKTFEKETPSKDVCPSCGGKMVHTGGCSECQDCGNSLCGI